MADHHESSEPAEPSRHGAMSERTPDTAGTAPEIVEAEVVADPEDAAPPAARRADEQVPGPAGAPQEDADEQYHQFLEFQEFQRFREWQRTHGGTPPPHSGGPQPGVAGQATTGQEDRRIRWLRRVAGLLRYKFIRRLLYLLLAFLLANAAIEHYFGGGGTAGGGGSAAGEDPGGRPVLQTSPKAAVITVYDFVATKPDAVCVLFTPPARAAFAAAHEAKNCTGAAAALHARVTAPFAYKSPEFSPSAVQIVGEDASVTSCGLEVRGGPRLGTFGLSRQPQGGWLVDGYEFTSECPR